MHIKKMIAPIIITVMFVIYFIGFILACIFIDDMPMPMKIFGSVVALALTGTFIFVLVERINEIRSGEEDDISKY